MRGRRPRAPSQRRGLWQNRNCAVGFHEFLKGTSRRMKTTPGLWVSPSRSAPEIGSGVLRRSASRQFAALLARRDQAYLTRGPPLRARCSAQAGPNARGFEWSRQTQSHKIRPGRRRPPRAHLSDMAINAFVKRESVGSDDVRLPSVRDLDFPADHLLIVSGFRVVRPSAPRAHHLARPAEADPLRRRYCC